MIRTKQKKYLLIAIIAFLLFSLTCLTGCFETTKKVFSRDAKTSDISINLSQEFSLNITYEMKPKVDIEGLELTFKYFDKNKTVITTKTKYVGDVTKDIKYSITVSLTEFSFFEIFKLNSVSMAVTNGTVTYLQ